MRPGPSRPGVRARAGRCRSLGTNTGWRVRPAVGRSVGPGASPRRGLWVPPQPRLLVASPSLVSVLCPRPPPPHLSLPRSGLGCGGLYLLLARSCFKVRRRPLGLRGRPIRGDLVTASSRSPAPPAAQTDGQGWGAAGMEGAGGLVGDGCGSRGTRESCSCFPASRASASCHPRGLPSLCAPVPRGHPPQAALSSSSVPFAGATSGAAQAGIGAGSAQPTADA